MKKLTILVVLTLSGTILLDSARPTLLESSPVSGLKVSKVSDQQFKPIEGTLKEVTGTFKGTPVAAKPQLSGTKEQWMAAAGIPQSQWGYVDSIVSRESGWKPCAYNPGLNDCNATPTSACGLAQSLPCGKQSKYGHWTDPVANLKWQYEYVTGRYGGYAQAVAFWNVNHYY